MTDPREKNRGLDCEDFEDEAQFLTERVLAEQNALEAVKWRAAERKAQEWFVRHPFIAIGLIFLATMTLCISTAWYFR